MKALLHKILYRTLPLEGYLRAVSRLFFISYRLGLGRRSAATEYVYHLPRLAKAGDTAIDIGANLGYYARPLSEIVGTAGRVHAVEPVPVVCRVLRRNLRGCRNVEIFDCALGAENKEITMSNDSARETGYLGTGRNFVGDAAGEGAVTFTARMRRGSELFAGLERLDFVKCDVEGYELIVMHELRPLLERFRPTVLIETGGENRPQIIELFTELCYTGYTLDRGREIPLTDDSSKDIIFTVVPELLASPLNESILKRAQEKGLVEIHIHNIRDYTEDKHRTTDDYPFGGEAGMVMKIEPIYRCIEALKAEREYDEVIYTSPDGIRYDQHEANRLSTLDNLIILCGHYKGIDYRIREHLVTREISIGDYVLTGGELAACIIADSVIRIIPGAIGDEASALTDCFQDNLLAPPVYTRPAEFNGWKVPDVLLSGNFARIDRWKEEQAWERTKRLRPDLLKEE